MNLEGTTQGFLSIGNRYRKNGRTYYHVYCACGNECEMLEDNLIRNNTKFCKCRGHFVKKGERFGNLVAQERMADGLWKCQCDCGNIAYFSPSSLLNHNNNSCGCKKQANNVKVRSDSKTGVKGVCFNIHHNKYFAYINKNGKRYNLGHFNTLEEAILSRKLAEKVLFSAQNGTDMGPYFQEKINRKNVGRSNTMSRKACLLTQNDVPQYIKEIVQRLHPVLMEFEDEDGNWWGYTFQLDAKWKCGYESQLQNDCEKLLKWCESWYAHAKLIKYMWWYNEVSTSTEHEYKGTHWHQRKALREGWRNHAYLVISDPVARRFEKDGFYKDTKQ